MAFIAKRGNRITDRLNFGKDLSYSFPLPFNKRNQERVLRVHDILVGALSPQDRSVLTGKAFAKLVSATLELSSEDLVEIRRNGILVQETEVDAKDAGTKLSTVLNGYAESLEYCDGKNEKQQRAGIVRMSNVHRYLNTEGMLYVESFGREQVRAYKEWRRHHRRPEDIHGGVVHADTINREIDMLRRALRWAEDELGCIPKIRNFRGLKERKTALNTRAVEALTIQQQEELLGFLKHYDSYVRDSVVFLLLTGLRSGEFRSLSPAHFQSSRTYSQLYSVSANGVRSGGKSENAARKVPLCQALNEIVKRGKIFYMTEKLNKNYLNTFLKRLRRDGLSFHCTPHMLRHSFSTNLICAGYDVVNVSQRMGHSSIQLTADRYSSLTRTLALEIRAC